MDWSLVLASQGIEAVIEYSPDGPGWQLLVPETDYEKSRDIIRQYQIENRGWPFQQPIFGTDLRFDWSSLAWVGLVILFFGLDSQFDLRSGAVMESSLLRHGQWWRLFTALWLHADLGHLASNAALGFVLLGLVLARYGTMLGLLAACLAGAGGNLLAALITPQPYRSLGASGLVMGCVGLLCFQSALVRGKAAQRLGPALRYVLTGVFAGVMLFVLLAVGPGTDILAHLGGFVSGIILSGLLAWLPSSEQKPSLGLVSGVTFALLVIVPWWLALQH